MNDQILLKSLFKNSKNNLNKVATKFNYLSKPTQLEIIDYYFCPIIKFNLRY